MRLKNERGALRAIARCQKLAELLDRKAQLIADHGESSAVLSALGAREFELRRGVTLPPAGVWHCSGVELCAFFGRPEPDIASCWVRRGPLDQLLVIEERPRRQLSEDDGALHFFRLGLVRPSRIKQARLARFLEDAKGSMVDVAVIASEKGDSSQLWTRYGSNTDQLRRAARRRAQQWTNEQLTILVEEQKAQAA